MTNTNTIYNRAIARWGADAQMAMLYEEIGELLMTLGHYGRGRCGVDDIAGELADVAIMLEQAAIVFGCADKVAEMRAAKLARLEKRLDEADAKVTTQKRPRTCNRHEDCDAAEQKVRASGREPGAGFHCHNDACEDCFGD